MVLLAKAMVGLSSSSDKYKVDSENYGSMRNGEDDEISVIWNCKGKGCLADKGVGQATMAHRCGV